MKTISIIPARMGSSRFPGKPMAKIASIPMIGHVWARTKMSNILDEVYVATCDQEIFDYIKMIGGNVVMTSNEHQRCTDRCEEALFKIEEITNSTYSHIVIVQGDEPLIYPEMIEQSMSPFHENRNPSCVNLKAKINTVEEFNSPNTIKLVTDNKNNAHYFSRSPVPYMKIFLSGVAYKQVCVMSFSRESLLEYSNLQPSINEIAESVDMMRFLDQGLKVELVETSYLSQAVDTPDDLELVSKFMRQDKLYSIYSNDLLNFPI